MGARTARTTWPARSARALRRRGALRTWVVALAAFGLAGCEILGSGPDPRLTGTWHGVTRGVDVTLTLDQDHIDVTGTGTVAGAGNVVPVAVAGTNIYPEVVLVLSADGYEETLFTGDFTASTTVRGELNGSGFVNNSLILRKR